MFTSQKSQSQLKDPRLINIEYDESKVPIEKLDLSRLGLASSWRGKSIHQKVMEAKL